MNSNKVRIKDLKLQARIQRDYRGYYYGEVYRPDIVDDKNLLYYMNCNLEPGWNKIASECETLWGCKLAIKRWKKEHFIHSFEI